MKTSYGMRKTIVAAAMAFAFSAACFAQTTREEFIDKYNLLTSKLGGAGVGVETLLDKWEAAYPDDIDMLTGRFVYYYTKSKTDSIEKKPGASTFLGAKPALTLKDSTGTDVNFFEESFFDDELFGQSMQYIDRIIQLYPDRLDMRFFKITSLVSYEKESPDMALAEILSLIDYNYKSQPEWVFPDIETVDNEVFKTSVQEYCYTFFRYGVPEGYAAFRTIAEKMLSYNKNDILFLNDLGSYYLVGEKNGKAALKYYNKVLKIAPDDLTAIRNCIILARTSKDVKLEKKYLSMMVRYADSEQDRQSAAVRLENLNRR